jgi:hypothetical protein
MLTCPQCGMEFCYGWECGHELFLFLLEKGRWICSGCGLEVISTHKIMSIEQIEALVADGVAEELKRCQYMTTNAQTADAN